MTHRNDVAGRIIEFDLMTLNMSNTEAILRHPTFQTIIDMGPPAIPILNEHIEANPDISTFMKIAVEMIQQNDQ